MTPEEARYAGAVADHEAAMRRLEIAGENFRHFSKDDGAKKAYWEAVKSEQAASQQMLSLREAMLAAIAVSAARQSAQPAPQPVQAAAPARRRRKTYDEIRAERKAAVEAERHRKRVTHEAMVKLGMVGPDRQRNYDLSPIPQASAEAEVRDAERFQHEKAVAAAKRFAAGGRRRT